MARRAAAMIRSAVATLLPPNFCTTKGTFFSHSLDKRSADHWDILGVQSVESKGRTSGLRSPAAYAARLAISTLGSPC